jgi:hypothetical protein
MKEYWGSGGTAPHICDLDTRWRRVLSFTLRPLYSQERALVPIEQEAGWVPEQVWKRWWGENFPAPAGTRTPDHPARSPALYHWGIPDPNL